MSDPSVIPPPPPPTSPVPPPKSTGLTWFFLISGGIVLFLTLGCILAVTEGNPFGDMGGIALLCGSPTLILGGLFLWLGSRRLNR